MQREDNSPQNRNQQKGPRVNHAIRVPEVRLVNEAGDLLGVMSTREALRLAQDQSLDLVEVAPNGKPPVCKIIDYGKYKYELKRKLQESKKKQVVVKVKEIQLSLKIGVNDVWVKLNRAKKFLLSGFKCKIVLQFKGREVAYQSVGRNMLSNIVKLIDNVMITESGPKMEGRRMVVMLAPKQQKLIANLTDAEKSSIPVEIVEGALKGELTANFISALADEEPVASSDNDE